MYLRKRVNTLAQEYNNILDVYEVDIYGNVYSTNGMELKQFRKKNGYLCVTLKIKGNRRKYKKCYVHRLVGYAFVEGYTEERNEIDHIDTNKQNNVCTNLRWVNRIENMNNPLTVRKLKEAHCCKECYVYDYRLNYVDRFNSIAEAEKALSVHFRGINTRCRKYYILEDTDLSRVLKINKKNGYVSVVITDIRTYQKYYFYSNRQARMFFDNKVNITQAIQKNWTVQGRYKVRTLNYKKLIGTLDI